MPEVNEILEKKGSQVWSISPSASVLDAAQLMNEHKIGALVVLEGERVRGIVTERDVLQRVVAEQRDPATTAVESVMTEEVACCYANTKLHEARSVMKHKRVRHLPVTDPHNRLLGLISIGDLNAYHINGQEQTIHYLHQYLYGEQI